MRARDVMSGPVVTVHPEMPGDAAAALLVANGIGGAPVVDDDGRLVGMVDEGDLVRGRGVPRGWRVENLPGPMVGEVMTRQVVVCGPDEDLAEVVARMLDRRIRSVPVVVEGRPVGMVGRRDVLRVVAGRRLVTRAEMAGHDRGPE
jgi:CBS domain-containing protein